MPERSLTPEQVLRIRAQRAEGSLRPVKWAKALGVSVETIRRAARGESYGDVEGQPDRESKLGMSPPSQGTGPNAIRLDAEPAAEPSTPDEVAALQRLTAAFTQAPPSSREVLNLLDEMAAGPVTLPKETK